MEAFNKLNDIELAQGGKIVGRNGHVPRVAPRLELKSSKDEVKSFMHSCSMSLHVITGLSVEEAEKELDTLLKSNTMKNILKGQVSFATRKQREVLKFLHQNLY